MITCEHCHRPAPHDEIVVLPEPIWDPDLLGVVRYRLWCSDCHDLLVESELV